MSDDELAAAVRSELAGLFPDSVVVEVSAAKGMSTFASGTDLSVAAHYGGYNATYMYGGAQDPYEAARVLHRLLKRAFADALFGADGRKNRKR